MNAARKIARKAVLHRAITKAQAGVERTPVEEAMLARVARRFTDPDDEDQ